MATFGATMLMGCMALCSRAGSCWRSTKCSAAAMAGALEINTCGSTTNCKNRAMQESGGLRSEGCRRHLRHNLRGGTPAVRPAWLCS